MPQMPKLKLVMRGLQRGQPGGRQRKDSRLPITPAILRDLRRIWQARPPADGAMLWAAVTTAFFGFFRTGEITVPAEGSFDPDTHLSWDDVALDNQENPQRVGILLKKIKDRPKRQRHYHILRQNRRGRLPSGSPAGLHG